MATSPSRRGAFNSLLSTTVTPIHTSTSRLLQVVLHSFQFDEIFFQYIVRFLFDLGFRHKGSSCIPPWRLRLAFNFLHSTMVTPIHTSIRLLQVVLHSFQFDEIFFQYIVRFLFDLGFRHKGSSCIPPWRLRLAFNFLHSTMVTPIHTSIRMLQVVLHSFQFDKIFFQFIVCLLFVFCLISGSGTKARLAYLHGDLGGPLIICSALRLHQSTLVPAGCCK